MTATLALQAALMASLRGSSDLVAQLGGAKIFDDVPQGTAAPYVTAGDIETRDWSSQDSLGHEHFATIAAWSRAAGRKPALAILGEVEAALAAQPPQPEGHHLVSLRIISTATARGRDDLVRASLRLRIVTEAI